MVVLELYHQVSTRRRSTKGQARGQALFRVVSSWRRSMSACMQASAFRIQYCLKPGKSGFGITGELRRVPSGARQENLRNRVNMGA